MALRFCHIFPTSFGPDNYNLKDVEDEIVGFHDWEWTFISHNQMLLTIRIKRTEQVVRLDRSVREV